jgi:hypothetical protein
MSGAQVAILVVIAVVVFLAVSFIAARRRNGR